MEEMESYLARELESKLKIEELQKDIIELKTSNLNLSTLNKLANEKNELQTINHAKETEKLEKSFHEEVNKNKLGKEEQQKLVFENKNLNLKLENLNILTNEKIEVQKENYAQETKNLAQSFHDKLKNASERSQTKIDKKEREVVELQKINIELNIQIEEKDLVIKNLVEREKELDENIAEKDAKIRSQAHEIGRRKANSFKRANRPRLSSI